MLHGIDRMFDHDHDGTLNTTEQIARNAYIERMLAQDVSNTYDSDEDEELDFGQNENDEDESSFDDYSEDFDGDDYNSDFGEDF